MEDCTETQPCVFISQRFVPEQWKAKAVNSQLKLQLYGNKTKTVIRPYSSSRDKPLQWVKRVIIVPLFLQRTCGGLALESLLKESGLLKMAHFLMRGGANGRIIASENKVYLPLTCGWLEVKTDYIRSWCTIIKYTIKFVSGSVTQTLLNVTPDGHQYSRV